ncbi:conserved hypothetical protein [Pediculus humanus corporis]|uniref:Uncharacterized protein n=1 Tax=Pediculus humanus subsp. corporis TaxID=121224 RepID=E0VUX4_PEDHC|nr:uncharacterized protein Phum_PHUM456260 [Pediculus humanus corporis]EEB17180.1 conserved hypothetical protein [Pediculus humanus corporis]
MSQNRNVSREADGNTEPDLSKCPSCQTCKNSNKIVNNPCGEEMSSKNSLVLEDKKMIALLASEIKIPEKLIKKFEIQDTGQSNEKGSCSWEFKSGNEKSEKFGGVKRVNSASLVEHSPKKEDWKNTRCNSDVSWSPNCSIQNQSLMKSWKCNNNNNKQFIRGNSRIRLISSSNSLNASLPRLTSHHSSSDEDWFEEIEEGDDDVLRMSDVKHENEENILNICPEYCGDKGATAKSLRPAAQSISRTNLFSGKESIALAKMNFEKIPSETVSCINADDKSSNSLYDNMSLTGKSYDGVLSIDEAKNKQKVNFKPVTSLNTKDSKTGFKSKPLRIFRRLAEGLKESHHNEDHQDTNLISSTNRESFENLIVDPTVSTGDFVTAENSENKYDDDVGDGDVSENVEKVKEEPGGVECKDECNVNISLEISGTGKDDLESTKDTIESSQTYNAIMEKNEDKKEGKKTDLTVSLDESWETIELGGKMTKGKEKISFDNKNVKNINFCTDDDAKKKKCINNRETTCCCILQ